MSRTRVVATLLAAVLSLAGFAAWWTLREPETDGPRTPHPARTASPPQTAPREVEGTEIPGLPRYPGSVRTQYRHEREGELSVTRAEYVTSAGLDTVRGFYREVFRREGWLVADYYYTPGEWSFLVVEGEREADILLARGREATGVEITYSEPLHDPLHEPFHEPATYRTTAG